jgi:hypothetical protein
MNLDSLEYLVESPDAVIVTTKESIENYVLQCMRAYLNGFMDGVWDEFRGDESEWDKAIEFFGSYVGEAIRELEGMEVVE